MICAIDSTFSAEVPPVATLARWRLEMTIVEGKNRQIRRLCTRAGLTVLRLLRWSFGPLTLENIAPGTVRQLSQQVACCTGPPASRRPSAQARRHQVRFTLWGRSAGSAGLLCCVDAARGRQRCAAGAAAAMDSALAGDCHNHATHSSYACVVLRLSPVPRAG